MLLKKIDYDVKSVATIFFYTFLMDKAITNEVQLNLIDLSWKLT